MHPLLRVMLLSVLVTAWCVPLAAGGGLPALPQELRLLPHASCDQGLGALLPTLCEAWRAPPPSSAYARGWVHDIATSPDGARLYSAGMAMSSPDDWGWAVRALDTATGGPLWLDIVDDDRTRESARLVVVSADGSRVYASGVAISGGSMEARTVAYAASDGETLWISRTPAPIDGRLGGDLLLSPDGARLILVQGWATLAYDAATGALLWMAEGPQERARGALGPGGTQVYAAWSQFVDGLRIVVSARDAGTGVEAWRTVTDAPEPQSAGGVAADPRGGKVYVAAAGPAPGTAQEDYLLLAFDATTGGHLRTTHADIDGARELLGDDDGLALSPDGSKAFLAGRTLSGSGMASVAAFDTDTGSVLWRQSYQGLGGGDAADAVTVDPSGATVAVAASSRACPGGPAADDLTTFAYDATTGALRWNARFGLPRSVEGPLAVHARDARVFVAGLTEIPDVSDPASLLDLADPASLLDLGFRPLTVAYEDLDVLHGSTTVGVACTLTP